jgi:hypothetical protein
LFTIKVAYQPNETMQEKKLLLEYLIVVFVSIKLLETYQKKLSTASFYQYLETHRPLMAPPPYLTTTEWQDQPPQFSG